MVETILKRVAAFQERNPVVLLLAVFLVTAVFAFYAFQIEQDSTVDSMFGRDSTAMQLKNLVSNEFGSTDQLYILVSVDEDSDDKIGVRDIREPDVLESMDQLAANIREESSVSDVFSINDLFYAQYGRLPTTLEESKQFFSEVQFDTSPFVSQDYTALNMVVEMNIATKPGALAEAEQLMLEKVEESPKPVGVKTILTGEATLVNRIMDLLIGDNLRTIGIAIVALAIILSIFFRSPVVGIIATIPVVLTVVFLAGAMRLLDIKISMMTAAVGAMMVGIGVDYSIHMTHRMINLIRNGKTVLAPIAVPSVGGALFASAATTFFGFIAMLSGSSPSSILQGTVLSIGIVFAFLATMVTVPAFMVLYRRYWFTDLDRILLRVKKREKAGPSLLQRALKRVATFQGRAPLALLGVFILGTIFVMPGASLVELDTDNENWIPEDDETIESLFDIGAKFGGLTSQTFLLMVDPSSQEDGTITDLRDPEILRKVAELEVAMEDLEFVNSLESPAKTIADMNNGRVPQDIDQIKELIATNPRIDTRYNKDYTVMRLSAVGDDLLLDGDSELAYDAMLFEAETVQFPEGTVFVGQGSTAQWRELDEILQGDIAKTTVFGFVLVFLVATLLFRSVTVGVLAFIPIIFALIWTLGIMGYIGLPFTVLTSGMLAIVMGIGIDFSIHLIHRTKEALSHGETIEKAVQFAMTSTGEAISLSTLTTMIGFSALILATLLGTQRMGFTLAIAIFSCFIACMSIVPAVLTIEHKLRNKQSLW